MNRTPVADWQQLSALYELADTLAPDALADWLAQLRQQAHPLLGQLEQMLEARSQIQRNGFLGALPRLPAPPEPRVIEWHGGSRIGPYRLLRKIGSGGMAEVWLAQRDDGAFQRQVAIKLLFRHAGSDGRDTFAQRFERERDILASLDHPHIAGLHDAGVTPNGQPWLALEYVEGQTLTSWCDARYLTIEARVRLFRQVLLAVQHAHANLVIHRDLKPGNILVTSQGEVRLLDFGIAKLMEAEGGALAETELTRIAGRPMTPQYASPEQLMGQPLTTACDVYSLGVVLYELLCGERPYELKVESTAQLEQAILDTEPRAPSRRALVESTATARGTTGPLLRKLLASDLDAIVLRALAKQPGQRYGSVEALRVDLDRWLEGEPVEARAPSTVYRVGKFVRRHVLSVSLGLGAVAALVAVTAVAVVMGLQAREDSARAVAARDFMLGIFQRADHEKSYGAEVTARDLLETGRKDVLVRLAGQPRLQAELLRGIAKIQTDMGEYASAESSYVELERLYSTLREPRSEAWARAGHADNAYQMGNLPLAQTLLLQTKEVPGRPKDDAELNARINELEGWILIGKGDSARAGDALRAARQRSTDTLGANHLRTFRLGQALLRAERDLGRFDEALALHRELRQASANVAGLDANEPATLDWAEINLLQSAGRFAEAGDLVEVAAPKCAASLGADEQYCRLLLFQRVKILLRLGLDEQALLDLPRISALAGDKTSPYVQVEALVLQYQLLSRTDHSADMLSVAERLRAFGQSGPEVPMKVVYKANALLVLAEGALRMGNASRARDLIEEAQNKLGQDKGGTTDGKFVALAREMTGVAFMLQGRSQEALSQLAEAQRGFSRALGIEHPMTQWMALNDALLLESLGRRAEALQLVDHADPILRSALGPTSPAYAQLGRLRARLRGVVEDASQARTVTSSGASKSGGIPPFFR